MFTILGLAGSVRVGSFNAALLRVAAGELPDGARLEIASIRGIPLYDGDAEAADGLPEAVSQLKERIVAANALLLVTPEYNHSVPGVFKNAIDWLSRPARDIPRVFGAKPVGVIGATPGSGGTRLAQAAWLPVLRALGAAPWFGRSLYIAQAGKVFDEDRNLVDETVRELLRKYLAGFVSSLPPAR